LPRTRPPAKEENGFSQKQGGPNVNQGGEVGLRREKRAAIETVSTRVGRPGSGVTSGKEQKMGKEILKTPVQQGLGSRRGARKNNFH